MNMQHTNHADLIGRLGTDPQTKTLDDGRTLIRARLATCPPGSREPQWHTLIAWSQSISRRLASFEKGQMVHVRGRVDKRSWDKNGATRCATEINVSMIEAVNAASTQQNQVVLMGELDEDAFVGIYPRSTRYEASLKVVTKRSYRSKGGEVLEVCTYHDVLVDHSEAARTVRGVKKGARVGVMGQLHYGHYKAVLVTREVEVLTPDAQAADASTQATPHAAAVASRHPVHEQEQPLLQAAGGF